MEGRELLENKYSDRIVLFADILGFKKVIENSINQKKNSENVAQTNKIASIFKVFKEFKYETKSNSEGKKVTFFSDSIVLSFPNSNENQDDFYKTLSDIRKLCIKLLDIEILLRGGISKGFLHHENGIVFGPALIQAHELESKNAIYPRIIIPEELINESIKTQNNNHIEIIKEPYSSIISKDIDGYYYIDYLTKKINQIDNDNSNHHDNLNKLITNGLNINNPSIKQKYKWMKQKIESP